MNDLPELDFIEEEDAHHPPAAPIALTGWETVVFELEDDDSG